MASPALREMRKPDFPAVVHTYTDVLRLLRDQPQGDAGHLARLTGRDGSNVRRDMHKLIDAGVVQHDGACWSLTDKGRQWVAGQDVAEGLISPDGSAVPVTRWPIDQIRPNPANRPIDPETIPDLALSIIGADDVLQPLILTPPDANGVRMILAGERRWRAVRHILETGSALPAALTPGVPFIEREATEAEALQITIIENSQRQDLSPWEDAQLLLQLQAATGWNASELARNIGRAAEGERSGLRDVQTKLKVAREASPAAIAAYLENRSWDQLRNSVSQPKAPTLSDQVAEYGVAILKPGEPTPLEQAIEEASQGPLRAGSFGVPESFNCFHGGRHGHEAYAIAAEWIEPGSLETFVLDHTSRHASLSFPRAQIQIARIRGSDGWIENSGYSLSAIAHHGHLEGVYSADTMAFATRSAALTNAAERIRSSISRNDRKGVPADIEAWLRQVLDGEQQQSAPAPRPTPSGPHVVNGIDYGNATRANEARYAAGILQRPSANYGSASRREPPASAAEPGDSDTPPPAPAPAPSAREELAEQRLERLGAALQVLTERLEPLLAVLRGDRTDDGVVTLETDDAEYYEHEISEACQWAEDALADTSTVFDGWGEEIGRADIGAPAVPIRQSITADHIVCLEDGRKFKSLKRHLRTRYNLSPEEYRRRWGLPADYPMVAPNYAKAREDLVRRMALRQAGTR
jgi:ParB/RepB/Spo0J family partition protein